ncbi:MAG: type II toxin-antitoxin system ParD family antitoxin [Acidimicrobiaceae bacterium]|nr:type II toxin-antitoxin system ParD family antitoxin [Acidimicrobiaceae bacterium]
MRTTRQVSITLPIEMADAIKDLVASGEYASESEVVRDGLRALFARDQAVEDWLRNEVVAAYDEMKEHPERGVSAQAVRARFAAKLTDKPR